MTVDVLAAPPLSRIANVELIQTGTWPISTGVWTVTAEDLRNAVSALECPAVRRPVLKLGHCDPRFDGEPAVGYVANMAVADAGRTLVGDYAGMPGWMGGVIASAFPDRSVEGQYDFRCQMGHTHPFVLTGVALLGISAPGVGTLESLQDIAQLYGVAATPAAVAASAAQDDADTGNGRAVAATLTAQKGDVMPTVSASVSSEDVIRAFYDSPVGEGYNAWVEEFQIDPMQIIYVDDATGVRSRVPVTLNDGDGIGAVTFGDPVPVVIRYEDAVIAASAATNVLRFASREATRPDSGPAVTPTPEAIEASEHSQERGLSVSFTDEQLTTLRQQVGVATDADEATILAAIGEALSERADAEVITTNTALPEGTVAIDATALAELQIAARAGQDARNEQVREQRERTVAAAILDGRIPTARREHWIGQLAADPGSAEVLASLATGLVPVSAAIGSATAPDVVESDAVLYAALFGTEAKNA